VPSPGLIALLLILFLVLLAPTDRLRRAGWSPRALGLYLLAMLLIGLLVVELPGPARWLVPILVLGYIAPFVTARAGFDRLRGRGPTVTVERPAIKQVYGPARDVPRADGPGSSAPDRPADERAGAGPGPDRADEDAGSGEESRTSRTE
jgi:hypothetical protein